ncbi:hypothetical protein D3C87_1490220 [compost metagenome]
MITSPHNEAKYQYAVPLIKRASAIYLFFTASLIGLPEIPIITLLDCCITLYKDAQAETKGPVNPVSVKSVNGYT